MLRDLWNEYEVHKVGWSNVQLGQVWEGRQWQLNNSYDNNAFGEEWQVL